VARTLAKRYSVFQTTTAEIFRGGQIIEALRERDTGLVKFLFVKNGVWKIVARVAISGKIFVPTKVDSALLAALTLPTTFTSYGTTGDLFSEARELFVSYGFSEEVSLRATHFTFASWFPECLPLAPCLSITGPRPEAQLLLQILRCMVRRPLPLAEVSKRLLCCFPAGLYPTLLIDRPDLGRSARDLLSTSNYRTAYVSWKNGLVNVYCGKAIYIGDKINPHRFDGSGLHVDLAPCSGPFPDLDSESQQRNTERLQSKFLAYRCQSGNVGKVLSSEFDLPGLSSRTRLLARMLAAAIIAAPEIQARLEPLLRESDQLVREDHWLDVRCVAIEAALFHCHKGPEEFTYVGEVAATANDILSGRGATAPLADQEVGSALRFVGLELKRVSKGWRLRLDERTRRRIHALAQDFHVAAVQEGLTGCEYCGARPVKA
jgi:hypothetical protein